MLSNIDMLKIGDEVKVIGKTYKDDWNEIEKIPIETICVIDSVWRNSICPDCIRIIPKGGTVEDGCWYPEYSLEKHNT